MFLVHVEHWHQTSVTGYEEACDSITEWYLLSFAIAVFTVPYR